MPNRQACWTCRPSVPGKTSVGHVDPDVPLPGVAAPVNTVYPTPCVAPAPQAPQAAELPLARLRFADGATYIERDWPGSRIKGCHGSMLEVDVLYTAESAA